MPPAMLWHSEMPWPRSQFTTFAARADGETIPSLIGRLTARLAR